MEKNMGRRRRQGSGKTGDMHLGTGYFAEGKPQFMKHPGIIDRFEDRSQENSCFNH
jgi:hypothetical protein